MSYKGPIQKLILLLQVLNTENVLYLLMELWSFNSEIDKIYLEQLCWKIGSWREPLKKFETLDIDQNSATPLWNPYMITKIC